MRSTYLFLSLSLAVSCSLSLSFSLRLYLFTNGFSSLYTVNLAVMPSPRVTSQITLYEQFAGANTNLIIGSGTCYAAHVRIGACTKTGDAYQKLICERLHKYSASWWWKENGRRMRRRRRRYLLSRARDVSSFLDFQEEERKEEKRKDKGQINPRQEVIASPRIGPIVRGLPFRCRYLSLSSRKVLGEMKEYILYFQCSIASAGTVGYSMNYTPHRANK